MVTAKMIVLGLLSLVVPWIIQRMEWFKPQISNDDFRLRAGDAGMYLECPQCDIPTQIYENITIPLIEWRAASHVRDHHRRLNRRG